MGVRGIVPGVAQVSMGPINAFVIETDHVTIIDTGYAGSEGVLLREVRALGWQPRDVRHILVTHAHHDHAGSLAALKAATGADAWAHEKEAAVIRRGTLSFPLTPSPGLLPRILFRMFIPHGPVSYPIAEVDHVVTDGDVLPVAGGIRVVHVPGHTAGHLAFLWPQRGGVLFAADAAANFAGLGASLWHEDHAEARRSLAKLASLDFAVACFGHGRPITRRAAERFRRKWGAR
jgi:glyoxylase-like metal-dependent hydrolase (beta-lactamase superfamily II)